VNKEVRYESFPRNAKARYVSMSLVYNLRSPACFKGDEMTGITYCRILLMAIVIILLGHLSYHIIQSESHVPDVPSISGGVSADGLGCGPAALMAIAQVHGGRTAAKLYLLLTEDKRAKGAVTSLYDLTNWAKAAGMNALGLKIDSTELAKLPLPAIVHTKRDHFLALISVDDRQVVVVNQGSSKYKVSRREFEDMFSGYVLCFR